MKLSRFLIALLFVGAFTFTSCKETENEAEEMETEMEQEANEMESDMEEEMDEADDDAPMVGGAKMYADKTIVQNASQAGNLTTLVSAVKAAELVETLSGEGPFTVFAPTNTAFENLPDGTLDTVLKPENKEMLQGILTYHVVSGNVMAEDLKKMITSNNGTATVKTVAGGELKAMIKNGKVMIQDANGGTATVTNANVKQSNGVVHVVDAVLLPKS
jgi:uncharacterized surface protein with fasciclin (FAS1) repeats